MKYKKLLYLTAFTVLYFIFSVGMVLFTTTFLSVWLGINVGFAVVPLAIMMYLKIRSKEQDYKLNTIIVIMFIVFVFFLPNALYIITDFQHLQRAIQYDYGGFVDLDTLVHFRYYSLIVHITLSAVIGIYAYVESLFITEVLLDKIFKNKYLTMTCLSVLMLLSSIGIYIGRFLRFFSWDILNPFNVIKTLLEDFSLFTVLFVLIFSFVHFVLYLGYRVVIKREFLFVISERTN